VTAALTVTYVIAAYNEVEALPETVPAVVARLSEFPGSEVIVVENGSTDETFDVACRLRNRCQNDAVAVQVTRSSKGLGNAIRRGIGLASGKLVVITAADLPFGFSDLNALLALNIRPVVALGSKAHPGSQVATSFERRLMSTAFRAVRYTALGLRIRDSQGSVLIDRDLAHHVLPFLQSEGYLITTEIAALAARAGYRPLELPVVYLDPRSDSKVRPLQDSWETLRAVLELRQRLGELPESFRTLAPETEAVRPELRVV
jgi:glycosyltransferase involved in cell wall biosynthesis